MTFPFCAALWVEAALVHASPELRSLVPRRNIVASPEFNRIGPCRSPVLLVSSAASRRLAGSAVPHCHVAVVGCTRQQCPDADVWTSSRIAVYVSRRAAPLRASILQIRHAPEWAWRGWLFPERLEAWQRAMPALRALAHAKPAGSILSLCATHPVQGTARCRRVPLLEEFAKCMPCARLYNDKHASLPQDLDFLYARSWAALGALRARGHRATWTLVDQSLHKSADACVPPATVHAARGAQTLLGPAPEKDGDPKDEDTRGAWEGRGLCHPSQAWELRQILRDMKPHDRRELVALVPIPLDHPGADAWLDERVHGPRHVICVSTAEHPAWSGGPGYFRIDSAPGSERRVGICPAWIV